MCAELFGDDIPYHLRDEAPPLAECNRCHRKTWAPDMDGTEDRMTQPDGNPELRDLVDNARRLGYQLGRAETDAREKSAG